MNDATPLEAMRAAESAGYSGICLWRSGQKYMAGFLEKHRLSTVHSAEPSETVGESLRRLLINLEKQPAATHWGRPL